MGKEMETQTNSSYNNQIKMIDNKPHKKKGQNFYMKGKKLDKDMVVHNSIRKNTYMDCDTGKIWFEDDWLSWLYQFTHDSDIQELIWKPYYQFKFMGKNPRSYENTICRGIKSYLPSENKWASRHYSHEKHRCSAFTLKGLPCKCKGEFKEISHYSGHPYENLINQALVVPNKAIHIQVQHGDRPHKKGIYLCNKHENMFNMEDIIHNAGYGTNINRIIDNRAQRYSEKRAYIDSERPSVSLVSIVNMDRS